MKNIRGLFLTVVAVVFVFQAQAEEQIEKVLADKKFEVVKDASLSIEHKFGTIKCKNWNENAISVKVTATVKASNESKALDIMDKISIKLDGNRNGVTVESDLSNRLFENKKSQISIDIEIMMPETVTLDVDHQFGNAYVETVTGPANISIEYGSIEINALKNESNSIEVGFGEARINYLHMGEVEVSYSTLSIDEGLNLNIESSYSNVNLGKTEVVEIENEGGNVEMDYVSDVELSSKFSEYKISELGSRMIADTEYGSLKVRNISADFTEISVENSFGSVNLDFDNGAGFDIEASMEFCSLDYPESEADFSKKISEATEKYFEGTMGDKSGKSKVTITSSFGNVSIDF